MSKEIEVVSIQMLIQGRELTLQQRGDAQQELNRLQSKIEALTKENKDIIEDIEYIIEHCANGTEFVYDELNKLLTNKTNK